MPNLYWLLGVLRGIEAVGVGTVMGDDYEQLLRDCMRFVTFYVGIMLWIHSFTLSQAPFSGMQPLLEGSGGLASKVNGDNNRIARVIKWLKGLAL